VWEEVNRFPPTLHPRHTITRDVGHSLQRCRHSRSVPGCGVAVAVRRGRGRVRRVVARVGACGRALGVQEFTTLGAPYVCSLCACVGSHGCLPSEIQARGGRSCACVRACVCACVCVGLVAKKMTTFTLLRPCASQATPCRLLGLRHSQAGMPRFHL
jgi:hypothetical protein